MAERIVWFVGLWFVGAVIVSAAIFYFAWVGSLAGPVDWTRTLQAALICGPAFGWPLASWREIERIKEEGRHDPDH